MNEVFFNLIKPRADDENNEDENDEIDKDTDYNKKVFNIKLDLNK